MVWVGGVMIVHEADELATARALGVNADLPLPTGATDPLEKGDIRRRHEGCWMFEAVGIDKTDLIRYYINR